jgi:hypothetical protein
MMTVSSINIGENNLLMYHFLFLVVVIKYILRYGSKEMFKPLPITAFIISCFIFIFSSAVVQNIYVYDISRNYGDVRIKVQQFTQYLYLLFGYFTSVIIKMSLDYEVTSYKNILDTLIYSLSASLLIALMQRVLPIQIINTYFRNTVHVGYSEINSRLSSTFNEPSFFALFASPMFFVTLMSTINNEEKHINLFNIIIIVFTLYVFIDNRSTSFLAGLVVGLVCLLAIWLRDNIYYRTKYRSIRAALLTAISFGVIVSFLVIYSKQIAIYFNSAIEKIMLQQISGVERYTSFFAGLDLFRRSWLIGIGFGSIRTLNMFTNWLAQVGVIGFSAYIFPLLLTIYRLWHMRTREADQLFVGITVSNAILMSSVPEYSQLLMWILYGCAYHLIEDKKIVLGTSKIATISA